MSETINHPPHYNVGGIEVIDAIEAWKLGFHLGNAVTYIARCDYKGNALEDLKKARWYLDREIANRTPQCAMGTQGENCAGTAPHVEREDPHAGQGMRACFEQLEKAILGEDVTFPNLNEVRRRYYKPEQAVWNMMVRLLTRRRLASLEAAKIETELDHADHQL